MEFIETEVSGVISIQPRENIDERGGYTRIFDATEFARHNLVYTWVEFNHSRSHRAGTLRGIHYQKHPHEQVKLFRCIKGSIYSVVVDLRKDSTTFGRWVGVTLDASKGNMLYIPAGCGNSYQTLSDDVEIFYAVSSAYHPSSEAGIRWDDPYFGIDWPLTPTILSEKDKSWNDYEF